MVPLTLFLAAFGPASTRYVLRHRHAARCRRAHYTPPGSKTPPYRRCQVLQPIFAITCRRGRGCRRAHAGSSTDWPRKLRRRSRRVRPIRPISGLWWRPQRISASSASTPPWGNSHPRTHAFGVGRAASVRVTRGPPPRGGAARRARSEAPSRLRKPRTTCARTCQRRRRSRPRWTCGRLRTS